MNNQTYRFITIFGLFLALTTVGVHAQTPSKVVVNIPFEFSAGTARLKAGVYSINRRSGDYLMLRSEDGKSTVILNAAVTLTSSDPESVERLVFNKAGDHYFLSQIWLTVDTGRQVWKEKKGEKSERIEIALRKN